jgi:hypothetical protein
MSGVFSGLISGIIVGTYFAEKGLPFPLRYNKKPEQAGSLELDLQVVTTIVDDVRNLVGYGRG